MPGKMARSDARPSVWVTRVLVAVSTSRLSCKRAGQMRTLMPVWDSSGESRMKTKKMPARSFAQMSLPQIELYA
jgi:hypothetical protein